MNPAAQSLIEAATRRMTAAALAAVDDAPLPVRKLVANAMRDEARKIAEESAQ